MACPALGHSQSISNDFLIYVKHRISLTDLIMAKGLKVSSNQYSISIGSPVSEGIS